MQDQEFGSENSHTLDFDFQHDIAITKDNYFNWGLGYRFVADAFFDGQYSTIDPTYQDLHLVSAFIQDKALFFSGKLQLTLGTKVQYYTLSDWDFQPSVRLLWKLHPEHRLWAAFSRATRSPSRGETAFNLKPIDLRAPLSFELQANSALESEQVFSYELGYRGWLSNRFSLDMTLFYNNYDNLVSLSTGLPDFSSGLITGTFENNASAQTWGFEAATEWRLFEPLRLQLSYSYLQLNTSDQDASQNDPENQVSFRGSYDFTPTITVDTWVRYVDSLLIQNFLLGTESTVNSYVGLDLRLAWKPISSLELSVVGQNLNNSTHLEYIDAAFAYPKQLERSFYGEIQWYF